MVKLVTLKIDGQTISVPEGTLIVDAAKKIGVDIPVFCYHPKMKPAGMCRMCLVDVGRPTRDRNTGDWLREPDDSLKIQFGAKMETACTTPVSEGMVVLGMTDKVGAARKDILEFLLTSHPLDCPVCDKGGECPLQNLTMRYGPGQSRFLFDEKKHLGKQVPLGELVMLDRERCIQCGRCVRFQGELVDDPVIGFYQRGRALEIITFSEPGFDSIFSGNSTDICPVGALTTVDFRFEARPWEMKPAASICPHCPVGCNLAVNVRREARARGDKVIKRVMPRQNESVNEIWICDKGRFAYHYTQSKERLTQPLVRKNGALAPVSWDEALTTVVKGFHQASSGLLALAGGRLSNEDLFNINRLATGLGGQAALNSTMAGGDLISQVGVAQRTNFASLERGATILVVACDLHEEAPLWWLRVKQAAERGAELIVLNPRPTRLDQYATHRVRYPYGAEAATVLAMVNTLSAKRLKLGENAPKGQDLRQIEAVTETFTQAENAIVIYGSEGTSLESSQALVRACANLLIATDHVGRPNNGLIAAWQSGNTQGAWDMGLRPLSDLKSTIHQAKGLYLVAADPFGDDPSLIIDRSALPSFLVVQELFLTRTAQMADVVLPAQSFTEREGTFTSGERHVQRFYPAVPSQLGTLPDFTITARIGEQLGLSLEGRLPTLVMERIAAQVPDYAGVTYQKLAEVVEQWPIVGRQDVYFGGTTYENSQGLGVQLAPAAQHGEPVSLGWVKPPEIPYSEGTLLAVPITRLYDRGTTLLPSQLLDSRIPQLYVGLHPEDARRLNIKNGDPMNVSLHGMTLTASACLDEDVPIGIVLVPRSMGLPVSGPELVKIEV